MSENTFNQLSLLRRVKLKKTLAIPCEASWFNLCNIKQSALTGILRNMKENLKFDIVQWSAITDNSA